MRLPLACLLLTLPAAAQTSWYVDDDGCSLGTGSLSDPFCSITEAVAAATAGDLVLVQPGTYAEVVDFGGKDLVVRAIEGPDETVLDGGFFRVPVLFRNGETNAAVLEGFTIQDGFSGSAGAGICITNSAPTILGNVLIGNLSSGGGGAISVEGSSGVRIEANRIVGNDCWPGSGQGGGIHARSATLVVVGNEICGNRAFGDPVGEGGGIYLSNCVARIASNLIADNNASDYGDAYGGGISAGLSLVSLNGNTFTGNVAFGGDFGPGSGGGLAVSLGSVVEISNCIFWNDAAGQASEIYLGGGFVGVSSSSVEGGQPGTVVGAGTLVWGAGNQVVDPLFVDPANEDYRLSSVSPLIDAGLARQQPGGMDGFGNPRVLDGDGDGTARIDVGYHEVNLGQLSATGEPVSGGILEFTTSAPAPNWNYAFLTADAAADLDFGSLGSLLLDLAAVTYLNVAVAPGTESVELPTNLSLIGMEFFAQSLVLDPGGAPGSFTNRLRFVVRSAATP